MTCPSQSTTHTHFECTQDALLMKEKLGINVVNWEDLYSNDYFGLLNHPDWVRHINIQQYTGAKIPSARKR